MDYRAMLAVGVPIGLGLAALGCGMGIGRAVASGLDATGRQPEAFNKILIAMLLGCALIESLTIYVLFVVFQLMGKM